MSHHQHYYVPAQSHWPIIGSVGLFFTALGAINLLHTTGFGWPLLVLGLSILVFMLFGWFSTVIDESMSGLYSPQMDRSFRWGMVWFIFSEIMFFAVFFGALFYTRNFSVPWLGGEGEKLMTHVLLWPNFDAVWPLLDTPDPSKFKGPKFSMEAWGIPTLNTLILLTSGLTLTWAHWGIKHNNQRQQVVGLAATVLLGTLFMGFQVHEYQEAYEHLGLTLGAGVYGNTFFLLTGFHGAHVTIGAMMLLVMLIRAIKGHFTPEKHFAFEAAAWYWHFVDVVWLFLFICVYWL